jgi:hypothetical protein
VSDGRRQQGDQVGLIFAHRAIVYTMGSFLEITEEAQNFVQLFSPEKAILAKKTVGLLLGDFFTNSSGPLGRQMQWVDCWMSSAQPQGHTFPLPASTPVRPGTDVMITIFCDFLQFSAKNLAFFSKTNVMI